MNQNLRILPLLIIVAMLTFSVRFADMVLGVSSISGTAIAEEKPAATPQKTSKESAQELTGSKSIQEQIADKKNMQAMDAPQMAQEKPESSLKISDAKDVELPEVKWRDASDQELDYANVRMEMFDDLSDRRKTLDKREKEMMTREALLRAAEKEIDRKYQELSGLRTEIEDLLEQQSEEEKARITSLVKIYEGMKPKDAARIFDTLDLDVLVAVMGQMSERKLSPVIAAMNPERARTITIMLAEQKKLPELPLIQ